MKAPRKTYIKTTLGRDTDFFLRSYQGCELNHETFAISLEMIDLLIDNSIKKLEQSCNDSYDEGFSDALDDMEFELADAYKSGYNDGCKAGMDFTEK